MTSDEIRMLFINRRHELKMSRRELAEKSGLSEKAIEAYEHHRHHLRLDNLLLCMKAMGLKITFEEIAESE